jgi:hypothetical protein
MPSRGQEQGKLNQTVFSLIPSACRNQGRVLQVQVMRLLDLPAVHVAVSTSIQTVSIHFGSVLRFRERMSDEIVGLSECSRTLCENRQTRVDG